MRRRISLLGALTALLVVGPATAAFACGGLIAPNGTINLVRTTTLAAYHQGIEHYVTSFSFVGDGKAAEFGSIVPLPGVPTDVIRGGDWTLQRLVLETEPPDRREAFALSAALPAAGDAVVLMEKKIDALDITVLEGGAVAVGTWAREHGFFLPPDAPEVLDFYARRSPIFAAIRFNAARAAAQGVQEGQGTPIHIVIPTPHPWVPLRILTLGQQPTALIQADVYLLTDRKPDTLPQAVESNGDDGQQGLIQRVSESASAQLMTDLRSDRGMKWMPNDRMWLTQIRINAEARTLVHDLAIDASGFGHPDPVAAGYERLPLLSDPGVFWPPIWALGGVIAGMLAIGVATAGRRRTV